MKGNLISALALRDTQKEYLQVVTSFSQNPVNPYLFKTIFVTKSNDLENLEATCRKIIDGVRSGSSFFKINEPWVLETTFQNIFKIFQLK